MPSTSSRATQRSWSLRSSITSLVIIVGAVVLPVTGGALISYELTFGHDIEGLLIGIGMVGLAALGFLLHGVLALLGRT